MAGRGTRDGKKFGGSHTSLIPTAARIADAAHALPEVTKIAPGFIKAGLRPLQGKRRVKIKKRTGNLLLSIRDNTSHQELTVYTTNTDIVQQMLSMHIEQELGLETILA